MRLSRRVSPRDQSGYVMSTLAGLFALATANGGTFEVPAGHPLFPEGGIVFGPKPESAFYDLTQDEAFINSASRAEDQLAPQHPVPYQASSAVQRDRASVDDE